MQYIAAQNKHQWPRPYAAYVPYLDHRAPTDGMQSRANAKDLGRGRPVKERTYATHAKFDRGVSNALH